MRIAILTTETPHHTQFVRALNAPDTAIVAFLEPPAPPRHPTRHSFEDEREVYESRHWFSGATKKIADFAVTETVGDMNAAAGRIRSFRPDLIIAFGTRILKGEMLQVHPLMFNLHGGDPRTYRGSDTHLWAIWHRQFDELKTCLHSLTAVLDGGGIASIEPVPIVKGMQLHQLRAANTEVCVTLAKRAIDDLNSTGRIDTIEQRVAGRVYSHMPAALKEHCVARFQHYTGRLDDGLRGAASP